MRTTFKPGFTLIELMVTMLIVGVLAAVAIPKYSETRRRANRSSGVADLTNLKTAQETFFSETNRYAGMPDTVALRFHTSPSNTSLSITTAGVPPGTGGWNAIVSIVGGETCGVFIGAAPRPSGMPATTVQGAPVCW